MFYEHSYQLESTQLTIVRMKKNQFKVVLLTHIFILLLYLCVEYQFIMSRNDYKNIKVLVESFVKY